MIGRIGHRTSCHTDPGGTISVNFLLSGKKRWYIILQDRWQLFAKILKMKYENFCDFAEAVPFEIITPELLLKYNAVLNLKIFNQKAGEIVIIPPNAFHLVEYTVKKKFFLKKIIFFKKGKYCNFIYSPYSSSNFFIFIEKIF